MTEVIECETKQWGSSIGQKVRVSIDATPLAKDLWNLGPVEKKESTQKIKDELRKGW